MYSYQHHFHHHHREIVVKMCEISYFANLLSKMLYAHISCLEVEHNDVDLCVYLKVESICICHTETHFDE